MMAAQSNHGVARQCLHCSTSQSYGDTNFFLGGEGRTPKPLNQWTKNLAWVIPLAITPHIQNFKPIQPFSFIQ